VNLKLVTSIAVLLTASVQTLEKAGDW